MSKEKFIAAIKANEGIIYKIASLYTNSIDDRKDLVQEIIYNLWKSFDSFGERSGLSTWMYRVAMNVAIYHLKANKRKLLLLPIEEYDMNVREAEPDNFEEKLETLKQYLNNLNLLEKGIVMLYLESKSYKEIAAIVGISESNVGTKMLRIKEKLKNQITKKQ